MVTIRRLSEEESARRWAAYRARTAPPQPESPPLPANVIASLALVAAGHLLFRTRAYNVPPIPWQEGIRLAQLDLQRRDYASRRDDPATAEPYAAVCRAVAAVAWRVAQPGSRLGRLARRLGLYRNPFRNASEEELGDLLDFLLLSRTRSRVRARLEDMEGPAGPWM